MDEEKEIIGYFSDTVPEDEISLRKLGGGKHSDGTRRWYDLYFRPDGINRECKYFDEKDPNCHNSDSDNINGCCIYHRHKYNELLAGEKTNQSLLTWMINKGVLKEETKLTEWENYS